jgi:hypothetical protein
MQFRSPLPCIARHRSEAGTIRIGVAERPANFGVAQALLMLLLEIWHVASVLPECALLPSRLMVDRWRSSHPKD